MAVANQAPATVLRRPMGALGEQGLDLGLNRWGHELPGARAQDFGQRIIDLHWQAPGADGRLAHDVARLVGRCGWSRQPPRYATAFSPRNPLSGVAFTLRRPQQFSATRLD